MNFRGTVSWIFLHRWFQCRIRGKRSGACTLTLFDFTNVRQWIFRIRNWTLLKVFDEHCSCDSHVYLKTRLNKLLRDLQIFLSSWCLMHLNMLDASEYDWSKPKFKPQYGADLPTKKCFLNINMKRTLGIVYLPFEWSMKKKMQSVLIFFWCVRDALVWISSRQHKKLAISQVVNVYLRFWTYQFNYCAVHTVSKYTDMKVFYLLNESTPMISLKANANCKSSNWIGWSVSKSFSFLTEREINSIKIVLWLKCRWSLNALHSV